MTFARNKTALTYDEAKKALKVFDKMFSKMIVEELKCEIKAYEDTGTVYQGVSYLLHKLDSINKQWESMNKVCTDIINEEDIKNW